MTCSNENFLSRGKYYRKILLKLELFTQLSWYIAGISGIELKFFFPKTIELLLSFIIVTFHFPNFPNCMYLNRSFINVTFVTVAF